MLRTRRVAEIHPTSWMLKHLTVLGYKKRRDLVSEDALMLQCIKPGQADVLETSAVEPVSYTHLTLPTILLV